MIAKNFHNQFMLILEAVVSFFKTQNSCLGPATMA